MADDVPTTIAFPAPLPARRERRAWVTDIDGTELKVSNLDKPYWVPEGYTKADLLAYWFNAAEAVLPYLVGRPLTLKRMPEGADGAFFYAKQAPSYTPDWMATAAVTSRDGKTVDYLLARDRRSLVWLANLGCIELHPWHSRVDDLGRPDYAFFDLDPMGDATFAMVRQVALLVRTALDRLGLRSYPRTSGATGMQVYVPLERRHSSGQVRRFVGQVCRLLNRADPERTTMAWSIADRGGAVFLDHNMNTEGKNIAVTYSPRPERAATVATPLTWEEVATDVVPQDFTMATLWARLDAVGDLFAPVLAGGQRLDTAMTALGMDPTPEPDPAHHTVPPAAERLAEYDRKRDFARTPEPAGARDDEAAETGDRFVVQHHLARRLHHDLRLERDGTAPSWAIPKGLPDVKGIRHLAVRTEDHPLEYLTFSGEIPSGEYGAGQMRIWDQGRYDTLEWADDKVTVRLHGRRHSGQYHLFKTDRDWLCVRADDDPTDVVPHPPVLEPMLAVDGGEPFDDDDWLFEIKWDGVRAIATTTRPGSGSDGATVFRGRRGNDVSAAYPELAPLWERVLARNAVLDGEVVALDGDGKPSFGRLQHRMHLRDEATVRRARSKYPVSFMVFDLLAVDGEALVARPLRERLARLEELLVPGGPFQRSTAVPGQGRALFAAAGERGLEGLIAKRADSIYRPGRRSHDWRKLKIRRPVDVVIGGWLPGEGARARHFGALLIGLYGDVGLVFVGRVGTGFNDAELDRLRGLLDEHATPDCPFTEVPERDGRWVDPVLVARVVYGEHTEGGRLRHPSYEGLRDDIDPRACTLDQI